MTNHAQVTSTALVISDTPIRTDSEGRYCLNDLHKAAGGERRHEPNLWLANQQTQELLEELKQQTTGIPVDSIKGRKGGTFAAKELVYAYGMWISPAFHLKVIHAYDAAIRQATQPQALPAPAPVDELPEEVRAAIARKAHALAMEGFEQIRARLEQRAREQLPYSSPKEFLLWLDDIGGSDAELIVLSAHELWDITSMVAIAHRGTENALAAIHDLEAKTGRWWHGRPDAHREDCED